MSRSGCGHTKRDGRSKIMLLKPGVPLEPWTSRLLRAVGPSQLDRFAVVGFI